MNILTFIKHASKVTKKVSGSRPVLKGIHYTEVGVELTDSHRLYQAKLPQPQLVGQIINPETNEVIDGNYPNTERILPKLSEARVTFPIATKKAIQFLKAVKQMKEKHPSVEFKATKDSICLVYNHEEIEFTMDLAISVSQLPSPLTATTISLQYLLEAFEWLDEYSSEHIIIHWYEQHRPVVFTVVGHEEDAVAFILPIRKY